MRVTVPRAAAIPFPCTRNFPAWRYPHPSRPTPGSRRARHVLERPQRRPCHPGHPTPRRRGISRRLHREGYEEWLLVQNPGMAKATVRVDFMLTGGGTESTTIEVEGRSRFTLNVGARWAPRRSASSSPQTAWWENGPCISGAFRRPLLHRRYRIIARSGGQHSSLVFFRPGTGVNGPRSDLLSFIQKPRGLEDHGGVVDLRRLHELHLGSMPVASRTRLTTSSSRSWRILPATERRMMRRSGLNGLSGSSFSTTNWYSTIPSPRPVGCGWPPG